MRRLPPNNGELTPMSGRHTLIVLAAGLFLAGCTTFQDRPTGPTDRAAQAPADAPMSLEQRGPIEFERDEPTDADERQTEIEPGTGQFLNPEAARHVRRSREGSYTLNFENTPVAEVAMVVFEEILGENYALASGLDRRISLQTSRPLPEEDILPTVERVMQLHGMAVVQDEDDGLYRIMRLEDAGRAGHRVRSMQVGDPVPPGYQVTVIPLEYIAAREMMKILEPLVPPGSEVRPDTARNMLFVQGTSRDIAAVMDTINLFDVDILEGMSVGVFPLHNAEPEVVADELENIFGSDAEGPMAGMFRFIPVNRLSSIIVVTPQAEYLREGQRWLERLDQAEGDAAGRNVHVYRLQNADAANVAELLNQLYDVDVEVSDRDRDRRDRRPLGERSSLAPGLEPAAVGEGAAAGGQQSGLGLSSGNPGGSRGGGSNDGGGDGGSSGGGGSGNSGSNGGDDDPASELGRVRVVADTVNNALLVLANTRDYDNLRKVIEEVDIEPLQVLVDATIVEVELTDELRYGLQWFFRDSVDGMEATGIFGASSELSRRFPGFNYSVVDGAGQVRGVLDMLAEEERLDVLSSPSLMVLDNRTAFLRVGDQVPIRTSESTGVITDSTIVTSRIQFRDTGVLLSVTPRVNAGGMVTMEVTQEVSNVSATESSDIDSPTIATRDISSTVAVQSGETIVLGGLIRENRRALDRGIPGLMNLPLLGYLFRQSEESVLRTELIVLLTPRVAGDQEGARAITEEFRNRMEGLQEGLDRWQGPRRGSGEPPAGEPD